MFLACVLSFSAFSALCLFPQWASALVKDGKNLYEAEKAKRETFGKLFSKYELTVCVLHQSAELHVNTVEERGCLFAAAVLYKIRLRPFFLPSRKVISQKSLVSRT